MTPLDSTSKAAAGLPTTTYACTTCGAEVRPDAKFCRACGAAQTAATVPLAAAYLRVPGTAPSNPLAAPAPAPAVRTAPARRAEPSGIAAASQRPRSDAPRERRSRKSLAVALVAAVALAATAAAVILILLPNRRADEVHGQLQQIAAGATRSINGLNQATSSSRPGDAASLVALRAAATLAVDHLGNAQTDLRALKLDRTDRNSAEVGGLKDSLAELSALARVLARPGLVASTIAGLSAQANRAVNTPGELRLPPVKTDQLVAALEARDRALQARAARTRKREAETAARRDRSRNARGTTTPAAGEGPRSVFGGVWFGEATQYAPRGTRQVVTVRTTIDTDGQLGSHREYIVGADADSNCRGTLTRRGYGLYAYREGADSRCVATTTIRLTLAGGTLHFYETYSTSAGMGRVVGELRRR